MQGVVHSTSELAAAAAAARSAADGQSTGPTSDADDDDDDDDEEQHELSDVPTEQLAAILPIFHLLIERSSSC